MSGFSILLRITAIIFLVEALVMVALSRLEGLSVEVATALDAAFLVLLSSPFIFVLVIKPYVDAQTRDLRKAKETAEDASSTKDEFLAHMSHELRTPLNAVIGFAQLLQHNPAEPLSGTQHEYANSIVFSGEHLLEIINGMLDLAAIEADQVHMTMEDVQASSLFDECVTLMHPAADSRKVALVNRASDHDQLLLHTDAVRLKQALLNLLSNAIKYNRIDGSVTVDGAPLGDGYYRISVIDTGRGIERKHYDNIFEPFDRLGVDATRSIEGTGIGLTVTRKLVELMQGRIGFESQVGEGSTFWIEVPMATAQAELVWNEDLSVGVEQIDADHKVLVALVNKVSDHGLGHKEVDAVLTELLAYTLHHFRREEAMMAACGYPDLAAHQMAHENLATKATQLAAAWKKSESPELIVELLDFLRAWLVKHIMEEDKKIASYARGHEVEIERALQNISPNK